MKFKCDCGGCLLNIDVDLKGKIKTISFSIFSLYGKYKKLKKPKLLGDAVIMDNQFPKELTKLKKFLSSIK